MASASAWLEVGDEGEILGFAAVHVDLSVVPQQIVDQGLVVVVGDLRPSLVIFSRISSHCVLRAPRRDDSVGRMTLRADGRERARSLVRLAGSCARRSRRRWYRPAGRFADASRRAGGPRTSID